MCNIQVLYFSKRFIWYMHTNPTRPAKKSKERDSKSESEGISGVNATV